MKIAIATTFALVAAKEKKVPPRHPLQRLNKLKTFYQNFFQELADNETMKQGEADRRTVRAEAFIQNLEDAFNRPNCGYYVDDGKHGGPDPNPEVNFNTGKPRNRRTADNEDDLTEAVREWCAEEVQDNYYIKGAYTEQSEANWAECCQFDNEFCLGKAPRSGAGGNKKAYDRLSDNPQLKWKQITTGTRKWAQRYINNCNGMRKYNKAAKRANKMYKAVNEKYFA